MVVTSLVALSACLIGGGQPPPGLPMVDMHVHIYPGEAPRFVKIMDGAGVDWALNLSGGWPLGGGLEQQLEDAGRTGRLLVAVNLPWALSGKKEFPKIAVTLMKRAKMLGARALKIPKVLGLGARGPNNRRIAVNDPWLNPIWKSAGELGLPVVIHTADPKAFWAPFDRSNERYAELVVHPAWSYYGRPVPSFSTLIGQLEDVVKNHPKTTFVSVHFGNYAERPDLVAKQLEQYPNLYIDIAARVVELGKFDSDKLAAIFERYADRIIFGTDVGVFPSGVMLGSMGKEPNKDKDASGYYTAHQRWLQTNELMPSLVPIQGTWKLRGLALSKRTLEKIYYKNALRLFGRPPWASKAGAGYPPYYRLP